MIYLDWAASAVPQEDACIKALKKSFLNFANPSAKHCMGEAARFLLEEAREEISYTLGIKKNLTQEGSKKSLSGSEKRIFFTSGGTEANHIPLFAMMTAPCSICISSLEHSAFREQVKIMQQLKFKVLVIPSDKNGIITPEAVLKTVEKDTGFVTVMAVNNETGAIQPIAEIGAALEEFTKGRRKIHFHTDAVQAIGKIPFNLLNLPIHSASFSGHKIGAPRGIGFLYTAKNIEPFIRGGGQENGIRPGTENLAGILALAECLKNYSIDEKEHFSKAQNLMAYLIEELSKINDVTLIPQTRLENPQNFSPWILQFAVRQLTGEVLVRCLSERGICISTGSACSSKKHSRPVLDAMKVDRALQMNAVRVSIGRTTTLDELKEFVTVLKEILKEF
ncbi:cysteine desulfurase family protein [Treponema pedis]|uniref:cysteine desulfurase family protein n=1 Tax=Treponema pedis TaxID=409322 RepID=UPI003133E578